MSRYLLILLLAFFCLNQKTIAQSGLTEGLPFNINTEKIQKKIEEKQKRIDEKIKRQSGLYFRKLNRIEARLKRKLWKSDSALAIRLSLGSDSILSNSNTFINKQLDSLQLPGYYSGYLDSMKVSLNFIGKYSPQTISQNKLAGLSSSYQSIGNSLNQSDYLQKYIQARKELIEQSLSNSPLLAEFRAYQKTAIYYKQQMLEYKEALQSPELLERKLLDALRENKVFRGFFDKYSQLGQLFRLPSQMEELPANGIIPGLQTKADLLQLLSTRLGGQSASQQIVSSGIADGQQELDKLKNKLLQALQTGESEDLPGFRPNNQKTKSFWNRIELGSNLQTTKGNNYWPVTSDLGLNIGYKLNNRSVVGIGASYKIGWGESIRKIKLTSQGIGLRTYIDSKFYKSFWLTGGGEWNYRNSFPDFTIFKTINTWQQSILIGISILYDALWNKQIPNGQPIVFRVGYNFK
jgi:hypothetical protein